VERIPDDPAERRAWLQRWAADQEERIGQREQRPARRWKRVARRIESEAERLDWYLDRGLNTSLHEYGVPEIAAVEGVVYLPTPWHVLPRALHALRASQEDVLVDFGCGKGRIVHQAAKRPLRRVIGVEISPTLAGFAQSLVTAHRHEYRCRDVQITVGDAAQFAVPDDLTITFMFDPFRGRTMDAVLRSLIESIDRQPRRLSLIYVNPTEGGRVLATERFRLVRWLRGGLRDVRISRVAIFEGIAEAGAARRSCPGFEVKRS